MPELDFTGHALVKGGYKSPAVHGAKPGKIFDVFNPESPDKPGVILRPLRSPKDHPKGFVIRGTIGRAGCLEFTTNKVSTWAGPDHFGPLSMYLPGTALEVSPMGMLSADWSCTVEVVGERNGK